MLYLCAILVGTWHRLFFHVDGAKGCAWLVTKTLSDFQHFSNLAWLNVTCRHSLIIERLRIEIYCLVLVDCGVTWLASKGSHVIAKYVTWASNCVMMLQVLPIQRYVHVVQRVYCSTLVRIISCWLEEALEVGLPVAVEGQNIISIATVIGIKALLQKVDISRRYISRHF